MVPETILAPVRSLSVREAAKRLGVLPATASLDVPESLLNFCSINVQNTPETESIQIRRGGFFLYSQLPPLTVTSD